MSFILDALKKSETDRQERSAAEFAKVPTGSGPNRAPGWLLVVGLLLGINLVVLLGLLFGSSGEPETMPSATATNVISTPPQQVPPTMVENVTQTTPSDTSFANRVAEAKRNIPAGGEAGATAPAASTTESFPQPPVTSELPTQRAASLPTIFEVIADGSIVLPELHLDIHVYSETPADRFVFINMSKQREKSQLSQGPLVEEITPEGVILKYRGKSFLLPRD